MQQMQQMQQAQQQQQQHPEMRAPPTPDEHADVPWEETYSPPQRPSPPISVSTPESARQRKLALRQRKRERDEEGVSDDNSDGPVGPPRSSASK